MTHFFVSPGELMGDDLILTGENASHARVLRMKRGDLVTVCDGQGQECRCIVRDMSPSQVCLAVQERSSSQSEAIVQVHIFMAFPKADKLEHVIQKATELGAVAITGFPCARCVSRPDERSLEKKLDRWRKIAASAAEQAGRGRIPTVQVLPTYTEALHLAAQAELSILFYENERRQTLRQALSARPGAASISLLTGPEGGLEPQEVAQAQAAGLQVCTLGRRILRCETAPLCALAAVMFAAGEF